jgi:glycosyltransferase involved in cell wall biosynthesis
VAARVVIVQRQVRQYRSAFYELLRSDLATDGIRLQLVHSNPTSERDGRGDLFTPDWSDVVGSRVIRVRGKRLVWQSCLTLVRSADLVVVEQATQNLVNYPLLVQQGGGRPRVALWGHGRTEGQSGLAAAEAVKRWMSRRAHWWFAYTEEAARIVRGMGYPAHRVTVVRNATDTVQLAAAVAAVTPDQRAALRAELGLGEGPIGLFLGSLAGNKRLEYLVAAADEVRARIPDFELIVAGAGPMAAYVAAAARERTWLHQAGPRFGDELAPLLSAATFLMVPAWVGLVVVDGFAAGLPLVASGSTAHPPEIAYLEHGRNGMIVDDGGDPARYADAVVGLLHDRAALARLAEGSARSSHDFGADDMAKRFADGVRAALGEASGGPGS